MWVFLDAKINMTTTVVLLTLHTSTSNNWCSQMKQTKDLKVYLQYQVYTVFFSVFSTFYYTKCNKEKEEMERRNWEFTGEFNQPT